MIKYFTLLLITIKFITCVCYGQASYKNAIIINLKGDTVRGYIDYKNWDNNPDQVKFRENLSSSNKLLSPKDILSFEVEKDRYLSATVEVSYSSSDVNRIKDNSPKPDIKVETVFLRTLVDGDKSLYSFKSTASEDNFYIKNHGKFDLLIYKKYIDKESFTILENLNYRNQLYTYFEYPLSLQNAIEGTQYTPSGLRRIFELYENKQEQKNTNYKSKKDAVRLTLGAIAGGMHRSLKTREIGYFSPKTTPAFGLFFNIALPRNFQRLNLYSDLLYVYSKYRDKKDIYETGFSTATIVDAYNLDVSSLKLGNSVRYIFYRQEDFGISLQAGITNSFILSVNNEKTRYTTRYGNTTEEKLSAISNLRKYEQGYILGLGAKKDRYALDFRFEKTNGLSFSHKSNFKSYYILASYAF